MPTFTIKRKSQEERERCAALVRAYRQRIEEAGVKRRVRPPAVMLVEKNRLAIEIGDKVADALLAIEREIENPGHARSGSEFSLDELEVAERLIAEQEHNPFEG